MKEWKKIGEEEIILIKLVRLGNAKCVDYYCKDEM
jgi:hypothetical protein